MKSNLKKVVHAVLLAFVMPIIAMPMVSWAVVGAPGTVTSANNANFEIEGNLICGNITNALLGDDWAPPSTSANATTPPTTVGTCPAGTKPIFIGTGPSEENTSEIAATRKQDLVSSALDDAFGLGSKQEDTTTWVQLNNSSPAKSDIGNVYAVGRINTVGDSMTAMVGFERIATNGSAHIDYELNQLPFTPNANGALVPTRCSDFADPDPRCTTADIILAVDDKTSTVPDLRVFKWVGNPCPSPGTPTCPLGKRSGSQGVFTEIPIVPSAVVYAATNSAGPVPAGPWGTFVKSKLTYNTAAAPTPVAKDSFSEVGLDLRDVNIFVGCPTGFATVFIKSRASEEVNSALKDMVVPPIPFGLTTCGTLTIQKMDTSDPNNPVPLAGASFLIEPDPNTGTGSLAVTDGGTGDLDSIANGVISFTASANRTVPGTYTVTETFSPLNQTPLPPPQTCVVVSKGLCTLTFNNSGTPNLTASKSAVPASSTSVVSGQTITYTMSYTNTGNAPALSSTVTDVVDSNLTSVTPLNGGSFNVSTRTITWNVGSVAAGASGSVGFTAQVVSPLSSKTILNTATMTASNAPAVTTNTTNHTIGPPVLSISKSVDKATAIPGETLIYTLNYSNTGGGDATNVVISDAIPARTTFVSATSGGAFASGTVTWSIGTLLHGGTGSVSFTVQLYAVFPNGTTLVTNSASITSVEGPSASDDVTTTVTASPILSITKTLASSVSRTLTNFTNTATVNSTENPTGVASSDVQASVIKGTDLTYTINYANSGNSDASNVTITDMIPVGSIFVSATGPFTLSGGTVTWNIGLLPSGGSGSVTLTIRTGL